MTDVTDPAEVVFPQVQGHCPACGREGLYRGFGGHITCPHDGCPNPSAVDQLLAAPTVADHVVVVDSRNAPDGAPRWILRHPIVERLGARPFGCRLVEDLAKHREAYGPTDPGEYRLQVSAKGKVWHLHRVDR